MSKVIFFTDLHYGSDIISPPPQTVDVWGKMWGLPLLRGMIHYAESEPNTVVIHGGDEVTFLYPDTAGSEELPHPSAREVKQIYLKNAHEVKDLMLGARVYFARAAGNHDPLGHMDAMGFNRASHVFSQGFPLPHTDIIVCQPKVNFHSSPISFYYDPDHIISLIDEIENPNLIITSHWAFDRKELGISGKNGYSYEDKTPVIRSHLEDKVRSGKLHSVITLHGHSHRFRLGNNGPLDMLTMPAITQNNIDTRDFPCGLFAEIEESKNSGELKMAFKRIMLKDEHGYKPPVIQNVSKEEMNRYSRGRKPAGSRMRFAR